jgi:hypothetical protein
VGIDCHDEEPSEQASRNRARWHRNSPCRVFDDQFAGGQSDTPALVGQPDSSAVVDQFSVTGSESNDVAGDRN